MLYHYIHLCSTPLCCVDKEILFRSSYELDLIFHSENTSTEYPAEFIYAHAKDKA